MNGTAPARRSTVVVVVLLVVVGVLGVLAGPSSAETGPDELDDGSNAERLDLERGGDGTAGVWVHDGHIYADNPDGSCGSGVRVWNADTATAAGPVAVIAAPAGSRSRGVRVAAMGSGRILVHGNVPCGVTPNGDAASSEGAPGEVKSGGFEVYDVDDPANPVLLASVRLGELNVVANALFGGFGGIGDAGVRSVGLFTQGGSDYLAVVVESAFGNFRIYDLTAPRTPELVSAWGLEELFDPGVGVETTDVGRVLAAARDLAEGSPGKFINAVNVSDDGTLAYLAAGDAGVVVLDLADLTNPQVMSVALDGSLDGHSRSQVVWPSGDGTIVVDGDNDSSAWEGRIVPSGLTLDGNETLGFPQIPAAALSADAGEFFRSNPTGLTGRASGSSVAVDGAASYRAAELAVGEFSPTFADVGTVSGNLVWVGRACGRSEGDVLDNSLSDGDIAVVRRGGCEFDEKAQTAEAGGAVAMVLVDNQYSTPWSGLRIWDYSNPVSPVLASTFDTACSASQAPVEGCDPEGGYSAADVQVVTAGSQTLAYASWGSDGIVVIDVSDPYNPVEVARHGGDSSALFVGQGADPVVYSSSGNGLTVINPVEAG